MARTALVAFLGSILGGAVVLGATGLPAHAEAVRVLCTQVPQKPGQTDETYIANFMSEQLTEGRNHFTTVPGITTVMCAW